MARSKVKGAAKLQRTLRKLPDEVTGEVKEAVAESALILFADARKLMPKPGAGHPYADGTLEQRFKVRIDRSGLKARVGSWGGNRAAHIHLVEFGTVASEGIDKNGNPFKHAATPAMPFLFPAYEANRNAPIQRVRVAVGRALARVVAGGKGME
ncbi:HK97-gp10 family putative phage morphogenesis protein [Azospirillum agricola]|uniref:HK97-gp10 family putative phage morphogenesis protein n=1 Tax=Azospirillum agricola TaxID=1720247 RepID=UPI000A0F19D4|nr:HK97-gp10 family putative phage morphogenesis protein [Azospirillum agricola]SMH30556.1 phage protein, HK97 gp10 family [Azospirillum lipoferum]